MKLAINQPNFMPWLGYFDLIDTVDIFVFLDDAQLADRSFVNRNKIPISRNRFKYLTLSIKKERKKKLINQKQIKWDIFKSRHLNLIKSIYYRSKYFSDVYPLIESIYQYEEKKLSDTNIIFLKKILELIGIKTELLTSSIDFPSTKVGYEKTVHIVKELKPDGYYNFANGIEIGIHQPQLYNKIGTNLFKQSYNHPTYDHKNFLPYMSIIDLLFYELPNALEIIRSGRKWDIV